MREFLNQQRLAAELDRDEIALRLGHHHEVLARLSAHTAAHPLDERCAGLLMVALYRCGRQADALECYRQIRLRLADQLGVDPSPALQQRYQQILATDLALGAPAEPAKPASRLVPRQLPPDVRAFTGRATELAQLCEQLAEHDQEGSAAVVISAIAGTAGVGKTALAIHFGHRIADQFPDGQLYVDLRGYALAQPVAPVEALQSLLRGLGEPSDRMSTDVTELAATYRSVLSSRRVLVVLDNARGADQVAPLLPGYRGCLVLVTSRSTLSTVDGAVHISLDVLSESEALRFLARLAGPDRVAAEPEAATALVDLCARLPLAVRIAGARLAARPNWSIGSLVERMADAQWRLDELQVGNRAVRAGFAISYQALQDSSDPVDHLAVRAFRLLGVLDWVDMSVPVAAALLDRPQAEAHAALERLVDGHLLESTGPGRYRTHDLLRLFAGERVRQDETEPERHAALSRVLDCYVAAAEHATLLVNPTFTHRIAAERARCLHSGFQFSTTEEMAAWAEAEHANLIAAVRQAAIGAAPLAVRLTAALDTPFNTRGYLADVIAMRTLAAETAYGLNDQPGEALARQDLGSAYTRMGRPDEAIRSAEQAVALWRNIGDRRGEQACLSILGIAYRQCGQFDDEMTYLMEGLEVCRGIDYRLGEATLLNNLGLVYQRLCRYDDAISVHRKCLAIHREIGNRNGEVSALLNLGWAHYRTGQANRAISAFQQALTILRDIGQRYLEAESLWGLGQAHQAIGALHQARKYWHSSVTILDTIGGLTAEEAAKLPRQPIPDTPAIIQGNT